ncbi:MAG: hypothetical protein IPO91_05625 [Chloroflexi bacterium]|nr:hypothetical protein [Chloroflexota bacterium]
MSTTPTVRRRSNSGRIGAFSCSWRRSTCTKAIRRRSTPRWTSSSRIARRTQPPGASLGSIFKNPPGDYAGRLIESLGLKGYSIGGAQVSPVHANFFINTGNATASDYFALIKYVQSMVLLAAGIELETEIETLGEGF